MMPQENVIRQRPAMAVFVITTPRTGGWGLGVGRRLGALDGRGVRVARTGGGVKPRPGLEAGVGVGVSIDDVRCAGGMPAGGVTPTAGFILIPFLPT